MVKEYLNFGFKNSIVLSDLCVFSIHKHSKTTSTSQSIEVDLNTCSISEVEAVIISVMLVSAHTQASILNFKAWDAADLSTLYLMDYVQVNVLFISKLVYSLI